MAVNTSVVRNIILVVQLVAMSLLTLVLADNQTRQARYQCENLAFQLHSQTVHRAEVYAMHGPNGFLRDYYERELAKADDMLWTASIPACHLANPKLLP